MVPRPAVFLIVGAVLVATPAAAQQGGGNAQVLWGGDFRDTSNGNATVDGGMATLTLEHTGAWSLGDHFFFVDLTAGTFDELEGSSYRMYGEWTPRLSLGSVLDRSLAAGPLADVVVAAELHAGSDGHAAGLIGGGVDLAIPGVRALSLHLYHRDAGGAPPSWQATGVWSVPFRLGVEARFEGFVDVVGLESGGLAVMTQPQLLLELGSFTRSSRRDLQVGLEWYLHQDGVRWHSVPQALVRWAW